MASASLHHHSPLSQTEVAEKEEGPHFTPAPTLGRVIVLLLSEGPANLCSEQLREARLEREKATV